MNKKIIDELIEKSKGTVHVTQLGGRNTGGASMVSWREGRKQSDKKLRSYRYDPENQVVSVRGSGGPKDIPATSAKEEELKEASMENDIEKAKTYPKVEGYLRSLDKRRIDEGEDVPVTKREKVVRQADENAAKRLEAQGKSMSFDDQTAEYFVKCHSHVLFAETEDGLEKKKKEAPKANGHVFGADPKDKRGSDMEMVRADAYKSEETDLEKGSTRRKKEIGEQMKAAGHEPGDKEAYEETKTVGGHFAARGERAGKTAKQQMSESHSDKTPMKATAADSQMKNRDFSNRPSEIEDEGDSLGRGRPTSYNRRTKEYNKPAKKHISGPKGDLPKSIMFDVIDSLLEKAVYGAGARGGKVERGSHKDTPEHSKVRSATLSPERQKEIEERSRKKARTQAQIGGLHGQAAKLKSIDDRTIDYLEKARQTNEGGDDPRKEENPEKWKQTGDRNQAMHAGIKPKVPEGIAPTSEEEVDRAVSLIRRRYGNNMNRGHGTDYDPSDAFKRSLDYRTIDLVKALTSDREKEIHSAVSKVRMIKHGVEGAEKVAAKPEDVVRAARTHNAIAARTQKSICDKWQESPFITKGARALPIGPGGDVQDLAKDEKDDEDQGAE